MMKTRKLALAMVAAAVLGSAMPAAPVLAQSGAVNPTSPPARGTRQRAALMDAIRPTVEAALNTRVVFVVQCARVANGWALVQGTPQHPTGRAINPRSISGWEGRSGLRTEALLRFRNGRWQLVDHAIGPTDVWYEGVAPQSVLRGRCY